eukprot:m51a1_g3257 hypothetical protein (951) ;mRNA; f:177816-182381
MPLLRTTVAVACSLALLATLASGAAPRVRAASRAGRACMFEAQPVQLVASQPVRPGGQPLTALTLAFWFRNEVDPSTFVFPQLTYASGPSQSTVGKRYASLGAQNTAYMSVLKDTTYLLAGEGLDAGTSWTHIAATWSSATGDVLIYKNGKQVLKDTMGKDAELPAGGRFFFPDTQWAAKFFGLADEVSAWVSALTPEEVAAVASGVWDTRSYDIAMHLTCDDVPTNASTIVDHEAYTATVTGGDLPRVPSQVPGVNSGLVAVAVSNAVPTEIEFPEDTELIATPGATHRGSLVPLAGSRRVFVYTPPQGGLGASVDTFRTLFTGASGHVVLQGNAAPTPRPVTRSVPSATTIDTIHPVVWNTAGRYVRNDAYNSDPEGFPLTVRVTELPKHGALYQYSGEPVRVGDLVTDKNWRLVYNSTELDHNSVVTIGFDVSDEVDTTHVQHTLNVLLPDLLPVPDPVSINISDSSRGVDIELDASLDVNNEANFVVANAPQHGTLYGEDGKPLAFKPMIRLVQQWASEVVDRSSEYDDKSGEGNWGAKQILGRPRSFPEAGTSQFAWGMKDPAGPTSSVEEWIVVRFPQAVDVSSVAVYETFYFNNTYQISVLDENTKQWVVVFNRTKQTDKTDKTQSQRFAPGLFPGLCPVRTRTVGINISYYGISFPQIDAIQLIGTLPIVGARVKGARLRYIPSLNSLGSDSFEYGVELSGTKEITTIARTPYWETPRLAAVQINVTHGHRDCDEHMGAVAGLSVAQLLAELLEHERAASQWAEWLEAELGAARAGRCSLQQQQIGSAVQSSAREQGALSCRGSLVLEKSPVSPRGSLSLPPVPQVQSGSPSQQTQQTTGESRCMMSVVNKNGTTTKGLRVTPDDMEHEALVKKCHEPKAALGRAAQLEQQLAKAQDDLVTANRPTCAQTQVLSEHLAGLNDNIRALGDELARDSKGAQGHD